MSHYLYLCIRSQDHARNTLKTYNMANKYNKIKAATTRGYNDCVKGITTCPYKLDEELQSAWSDGFNNAFNTRRAEHEAAWRERKAAEQPDSMEYIIVIAHSTHGPLYLSNIAHYEAKAERREAKRFNTWQSAEFYLPAVKRIWSGQNCRIEPIPEEC
jgi:ribosome modulation factor